MRHPVRIEQRGDIAVIIIECPPIKTLSLGTRRSIKTSFDAALADAATQTIVIGARGRGLPQSVDLREFEQHDQVLTLGDLCTHIEAASKPVVAALQGPVLNAGLELAMAAHYRIASQNSVFGLTDIRLGLPPNAGGSQRLPRLVGADAALSMMLAGKPIAGGDAVSRGLIDALTDEDVLEAACDFAAEKLPLCATSGLREHLADTTQYLEATQVHTGRVADYYFPSPAASAVLKGVEAAVLMPPEAGLALEARLFKECYEDRESRGLRHAAYAERVAPYFPELRGGDPVRVDKVGIIGGGGIGVALATLCMDAGLSVVLLERSKEASKLALDDIAAHYRTAIAERRMTQHQGAAALGFINLVQRPRHIAGCDLIIDALPEDLSLKCRALKQIGQMMQPNAVLATTTSDFDIDRLATASGKADRFVGLHLCQPPGEGKLMEVIIGRDSSRPAVVMAHKFARRIKRLPLRVAAQPGFIVGRIETRLRRAADLVLLEGATPWQIDAVMRVFGFSHGPYQVIDRIGLDVVQAQMACLAPGPGQIETRLLEHMCHAGFTGLAAQMGFYIYKDKKLRGKPNYDVLNLIDLERKKLGLVARKLLHDEISEKLHLAIIDEAARVLEDGAALRASDIDTAMIHGMGYPRRRGGPLFEADEMGALEVMQRLERLAKESPGYGVPTRLVRNLATEHAIFAKVGVT